MVGKEIFDEIKTKGEKIHEEQHKLIFSEETLKAAKELDKKSNIHGSVSFRRKTANLNIHNHLNNLEKRRNRKL